jgi:hypothetical protein
VSASLRVELALDALEMAIWSRRSTRLEGRQLRQRPGRDGQRPLQDRAHPAPGTVAHDRPARARHRRLGELVERAPSPLRLRRHPADRVRGGLPFPPTGDQRGRFEIQSAESPRNSGRFILSGYARSM